MLGGKLDGFYSTWGLYLLNVSKACLHPHLSQNWGFAPFCERSFLGTMIISVRVEAQILTSFKGLSHLIIHKQILYPFFIS